MFDVLKLHFDAKWFLVVLHNSFLETRTCQATACLFAARPESDRLSNMKTVCQLGLDCETPQCSVSSTEFFRFVLENAFKNACRDCWLLSFVGHDYLVEHSTEWKEECTTRVLKYDRWIPVMNTTSTTNTKSPLAARQDISERYVPCFLSFAIS